MEEVLFPMQSLTEAHRAKQLLSHNRIVCRIQRRSDPKKGCGYDILVMREDGEKALALLRSGRFGRNP